MIGALLAGAPIGSPVTIPAGLTMISSKMFLALLAIAAGMPAAAEPIPLMDFARHFRYGDVKISPDGKHLAASAIIDGKNQLSLIDLAEGKAVNIRPRNKEELHDFCTSVPKGTAFTTNRTRPTCLTK